MSFDAHRVPRWFVGWTAAMILASIAAIVLRSCSAFNQSLTTGLRVLRHAAALEWRNSQ
jgi:hypothetical protein